MADITITGNQAYFNEDVKFFKDVYIYGTLYYKNNLEISGVTTFYNNVDFKLPVKIRELTITERLNVLGVSTFGGISTFYNDVYTKEDLFTKRLYVSDYFGVGTNNSVLNASNVTSNVGIGSINPQQKLDIAGSVKIDENIYDSKNSPAKNGYFLTRDVSGIRWLPLVAESRPEVPGISTDGIFILDEMVPLYSG